MVVGMIAVQYGGTSSLPTGPIAPGFVATGGAVVASDRLSGVNFNPAEAVFLRGLELALVSFPRTGLRGFSIVGSTGHSLAFVGGLWSYSASNLIDQEVVEQDPTLANLTVSTTAVSIGSAVHFQSLAFGLAATARADNVLGNTSASASWTVGMRYERSVFGLGMSVINLPFSTHSFPSSERAVILGASIKSDPRRPLGGQVEANAVWLHDDRTHHVLISPHMHYGPLDVVAGYNTKNGWSGGFGLSYGAWRFEAATNFVGGERLDERLAFSLTF